MALPHLAEQVGRVLDGRYRVVAPIGTGASAAVYLADDTTLRRRVALKVLHAALANDQGFLKRFQAEAHTAAALSHPNIMRVLDWGEAEDGPFLVLEYLGGGSLRTVLDDGVKLTVEQATDMGLQAARGLEYAHRRGLVHRDIKPGNLLFDEDARLAIADFGLARALAEAAWTEPGGAVLGTARYAAPEQVRGYSLDGKADVYALALVLFEAVCGYVPFTADTTIATLMARLDMKLYAPPQLGLLGPVLEKAAHPDREERIDSQTLVTMLEEVATQLPRPEKFKLPGAIARDVIHLDDIDQTMLPGAGDIPPAMTMPTITIDPPKVKRRKRRKVEKTEPATKGSSVKRSFKPKFLTLRRSIVAAGLVALLAASGVGGYYVYMYTGKEYVVPQMENISVEQAAAIADEANVKLKVSGEEFSETIPAGMTLSQNPPEGGTVHARQSVTLKVSKGPAPRAVVDTTGQMIDQARALLEEKGFVVTTENRYSETDAKGKVLEQSPNSGERDKGTEVKLVLSAGPKPRVIPDVKGGSYDDALAAITEQQLKVSRKEDFSNDVPVGQVAGTLPAAGSSVERDSTVTIVVSKGPELVAIPNVNGMSVAAATAALEAAGLEQQNLYGPAGGVVFDTGPAIGTKVKKGSSVSLYTR